MASLTGLQSGNFSDIDVLYSIALNGNNGQNNQVIKSDGENSSWGDVSGLISFNKLNADGSTITIGGSTSGDYDTTADKTIAVAKVPNALTAGTNVSFSSGSTYDGSSAITINTTDTDTTYQGSTTINIDTATNPDTINCIKVPNALTAGTNLSFSSGTTFDGSSAITINATDTNTTYSAGDGIDIQGTTIEAKPDEDTIDFNGTELEVQKVPNSLSAGTNLSYTSGSTFDGATARTINLATAPTNLDLTANTNYVCPYLVFDVYDPSSLDTDSLSTSYTQIFSGNLSNSFTAKTTAVEVQIQIFHAASTSNRWLYLRLSDGAGNEWSSGTSNGGYGTGTRNTERLVSYPDENDKRQMVMSWYLQGLTIGNSYTINPYAKTSSTFNYIYAGGSYPPCMLKVINISGGGI